MKATLKFANFWDNCGVWQSGGPVCNLIVNERSSSTIATFREHLTVVKEVDGQYCTPKLSNKKRVWIPDVGLCGEFRASDWISWISLFRQTDW